MIGEHFRVVFADNTSVDGVLEGSGVVFLKFFNIGEGSHFYIPVGSIKMMESFDEGMPEDGYDPGDNDDDEPDDDDDDDPPPSVKLKEPRFEDAL